MKTLRDGAVLLILLTLLVSVRVTPLEEPQGGIIPEARAAMEQVGPVGAALEADSAVPARLLKAVGFGAGTCPLRLKTLQTEKNGSRVIVIEVDEVEQADLPTPAVTSFAVGSTC